MVIHLAYGHFIHGLNLALYGPKYEPQHSVLSGAKLEVIRVCFSFHRNLKITRKSSLMLKRKGFQTKSLSDRCRSYDSESISDHNTSLYGQEMKECMNE